MMMMMMMMMMTFKLKFEALLCHIAAEKNLTLGT